MEHSFADLLSDAFSETSVPSFPGEDLDFESLHFSEDFEEDKTDISQENVLAKEDEALQQEATGQTAVLSGMETKDVAEIVAEEQCDEKKSDEEDFEGVMSGAESPEEDYTSSDCEQAGSVSGEGEDEEDTGTGEKPGDLLGSGRRGDELCDGDKEDRIFAEGQPLAPEGAENPQVRNEERGESDDEEASYFERVPERGGEMMMRGEGIEEDEQEREEEKEEDSCDSECEGMKIDQEENVLALCFEQDGPMKPTLEFPEISAQNLQHLVAEVDSEEYREKMKDFSGEAHQDGGESFADYPSDFSSYEYVENGGKTRESASACASDCGSIGKQNTCPERAATDATWTGRAEDTEEEGHGYRLYSRDAEVGAGEVRCQGVATAEEEIVEDASAVTGVDDGGESDSYTSSDDEDQEKRSDDDGLQDLESNEQQEEAHGGSGEVFFDNAAYPADFDRNWNLDVLTSDTFLSEDLLTTEEAETPLSAVTPAEDVDSDSSAQRGDAETTSSSNQGSVDDSFFFDTEHEASGISELGQLGDDEYEEDRNWEQEQQRIKAFYEFYDDSDGENEREGREIKVQFCADPLSQVICYDSDSSDRDSLSSSTEGEEDLSSAETSEELRELDDIAQMTSACDPPNTQLPENVPDLSNTRSRKHKCFNMLKLTLKMGLLVLTGLLMFWFAIDPADWLNHVSLF